MTIEENAIAILAKWYAGLELFQDKLPSKGTISAALHVLQRLRSSYELGIACHVAEGEAQITGLSPKSLKKVLAEFGETRKLSSIAGRSNRGARGDIAKLLESMRPLGLDKKSQAARNDVLTAMQRYIVTDYVALYFKVKRVKASFDPSSATSRFIASILENARSNGKAGPVAEHLVGAKLTLRFPHETIRNKPTSTSDTQLGYDGDFEIGSTAFHVTISPMPELFEKLKDNLARGKRIYLLVPEAQVVGTRQNADLLAQNKIAVESIESFVATNIDELATFDAGQLNSGLRRLIEAYNERVDAVEHDKSLLIEIPPNLA